MCQDETWMTGDTDDDNDADAGGARDCGSHGDGCDSNGNGDAC